MAYYIKGKGWFESSGKPMGSKRKMALARAKVCGYENDSATFTRLRIESGVSIQALNEAWSVGAAMKAKANAPAYVDADGNPHYA